MGELINPNEPLYNGEMTAHQWYLAEVEVNPELPGFDHPKVPSDKLKTPIGEIQLHHFNTEVVCYPGQFEHMSHIRVDTPNMPFYFFRDTHTNEDEAEHWTAIANHLLERDYTQKLPPGRPEPQIIHMYWKGVRGEETIDKIIERIINE